LAHLSPNSLCGCPHLCIIKEEEVIDANETFLRIMGYSRDDLQQGRLNWMHITAPDSIAITEQSHAQLALHEYIGKDESRLPVFVGGVMTQLDPPQAICFVLDNSARKALERRKDTFIGMAGHELRTPLTALKSKRSSSITKELSG
jgi:signal transduction histidine kinase